MEDETMEKIKEDACQTDLHISIVKIDMNNMPIKENISKVPELKQLQHELKNLCDQENKRNNEVVVHQYEKERVIELIHPV